MKAAPMRGRRPRATGEPLRDAGDAGSARDDAEVDDRLAPAIEDGVHERAELADLARRPGERAVEHVEDAAEEDDDAADEPELGRPATGTDDRDAEADERQPVGRQAEPGPWPSAIGSKSRLIAGAGSLGMVIAASAREAEDRRARGRRTRRRPLGEGRQMVSRPTRRVSTRPATRRRFRCWLTRGWLRPTWPMSSVTVASPSPAAGRCAGGSRRRGPCGTRAGRGGRRAGRRSRRWVERMWAGVGDTAAWRSGLGTRQAVVSTTVDINRR